MDKLPYLDKFKSDNDYVTFELVYQFLHLQYYGCIWTNCPYMAMFYLQLIKLLNQPADIYPLLTKVTKCYKIPLGEGLARLACREGVVWGTWGGGLLTPRSRVS